MGFTLVAWSESIDGALTWSNIAAVQDQHVKTDGDKITVPAYDNIVGSYALIGALGVEARLISPTLRRTNPLYSTPVELVITPPTDPALMYHPDCPIKVTQNESLEAEVLTDHATGEENTMLAFLSDGVLSPIKGEIFPVNCEITLAQSIGAWTFSEVTFPDSLPVGDYMICGARLIAAGAIAFRFVFVGGDGWRPGGICAALANSRDPYHQRWGRMGEWGKFNTVQPPSIEVLGSADAASATYQVYIDILKV
jgi:hypothetical protein